MPLLLGPHDVAACLDHRQVVQSLLEGFRAEADGHVQMPTRVTIPAPSGWLRVMVGVIDARGPAAYMGCKIMNLIHGHGLRYMIILFNSASGELLGLLDAASITQVRTAATAALAARHVINGEVSAAGILGSGFEARGLLEAMAHLLSFAEAIVYSRRPENREAFAKEMSARLGVLVRAVDRPSEVFVQAPIVGLATRSATPVMDSEWVRDGATLLSIGSTRPDLRELDEAVLGRARRVVTDSVSQVKTESGDIRAALEAGALRENRIISIGDVIAGKIARERPGDIVIIKTVGTALQDLVVAGRVYESARAKGLGKELGDWPQLKPFA
ncbi:MAG TPA: ornithine cyclodeaminase family protein [bacterium]|nr:ornithine cyclodeaminase family protein [bacterium]